MLLDSLASDPFVGHIQDTTARTHQRTPHKHDSGDQSCVLEDETDLGEPSAVTCSACLETVPNSRHEHQVCMWM